MALFERDAGLELTQVMDAIKIYIERSGKPRNFMYKDASEEAARRLRVEMKHLVSAE